jgi:hypothetical protein
MHPEAAAVDAAVRLAAPAAVRADQVGPATARQEATRIVPNDPTGRRRNDLLTRRAASVSWRVLRIGLHRIVEVSK